MLTFFSIRSFDPTLVVTSLFHKGTLTNVFKHCRAASFSWLRSFQTDLVKSIIKPG